MTIEIYGMDLSAPCRLARMAAEMTGEKYEFHEVDLWKGENMTPEYLKMNPLHTIPTMKDGDLVLTESRAIAQYLANAYPKDDNLYPKCPKGRAMIDSRLNFDQGTLYNNFGKVMYPKVFHGKEPQESDCTSLKEALGHANDMVKKTGFVAGTTSATIADLAFVATFSTMKVCSFVDLAPYPELLAWLEKMEGLIPNYEKANGAGVAKFGKFAMSKIEK
jgi:glutathione S-transferase